jgi:hypothetical protein
MIKRTNGRLKIKIKIKIKIKNKNKNFIYKQLYIIK